VTTPTHTNPPSLQETWQKDLRTAEEPPRRCRWDLGWVDQAVEDEDEEGVERRGAGTREGTTLPVREELMQRALEAVAAAGEAEEGVVAGIEQ